MSKPSLRDWIKRKSDELDVPKERLLFSSPSRDPLWKGTAADHRNGEWFAEYWRRAIAGRSRDEVHVRGVHYVMIEEVDEPITSPSNRTSWSEYRNTTTCYNYLKDASVVARVLGYVPLDGIIDEDNEQTVVHEYGEHQLDPDAERGVIDPPDGLSIPDVPEIGEEAGFRRGDLDNLKSYLANQYARDLALWLEVDDTSQQPYHVEVWSEKTPPQPLHDLAEQYGVNLIVTGTGDLSYQVAYNLAQRVNAAEKPAVILYLSDFDPKGDNMAQAMAGKISWLDLTGHLDERVMIKQLAVTRDQIDRYDLPRTPIDYDADPSSTGEKAYETLVNDWEQRKGRGATELQALWRDEARFVDEIEDTIAQLYDDDLREAIREAENDWQEDAREAIVEALDDSEMAELVDDVEAWLDDFNDHLGDASELIEDLNDLLDDDDRYNEWIEEISDTLEDTDLDDLEPPDGDADPPRDPLFDTDRSYSDNINEVRRHEHGER